MYTNKTTEELLKENKNWEFVREDRNGTRYFNNYTCTRCGGRGYYALGMRNNQPILSPYDNGVCYECEGSGVSKPSVVKLYTEAYERKLQEKQNQKDRIKYEENLAKFGFGKEDNTFVVYRILGETFSKKEELKEKGCKFSPAVGWYSSKELEGYECQRLEAAQVLTDNKKLIVWKTKEELSDILIKEKVDAGAWNGEIGDTIHIEVRIIKDLVFESRYPGKVSHLYIMKDKEGRTYKWSTTCFYIEGNTYELSGKVKDLVEYKGVKQTVLTRCKEIA